jgi:hypothetical protein
MEEADMAEFDLRQRVLVGTAGQIKVPEEDQITHKLLMLIQGECEGLGPLQAARKFGYSRQRYFQLRAAFARRGALALHNQKRGPKTHYRRTAEVVRQVVRHRFLDPDASPQVIAQKLVQSGWTISTRSVERVLAEYGLQKKTPQVPPPPGKRTRRGATHAQAGPARRRRSAQH